MFFENKFNLTREQSLFLAKKKWDEADVIRMIKDFHIKGIYTNDLFKPFV